MKKFNKVILSLGVVATAFGFASCVNDLDLEPNSPADITDVTNAMDNVFADIYLNFSTSGANGDTPVEGYDGGMGSFSRAMFTAEEIPTDEACWLWDPDKYGTLNYGQPLPSFPALIGVYNRLTVNITLCNQFINLAENGGFKPGKDENEAAFNERKAEYIRQAKILWGACYFYMMSFYDKIPFASFDTPVGALPTQISRAQVYDYVTAELEKVVTEYAPNQVPYYGFVGLDAAESILAKIYLNGEVFAGRADYDKCYTHCKNVIDRLGKGGKYGNGLAQSYQTLFGANNKRYVLGNGESGVNEIIWTIAQNAPNLTSYSGAGFLIWAWVATNGVEVTTATPTNDPDLDGVKYETATDSGIFRYYKYYADPEEYRIALNKWNGKDADGKDLEEDKKIKDWQKNISQTINKINYSFDPKAVGYIAQPWYNVADGWKCMVSRKSFVRKFEWEDVAMTVSKDTRVANWQTASHGFSAENPSLIGDNWGTNGYITPKFSNWAYNEDGTINYAASPLPNQVGGDYGAIRLAEIYLTAAEAILNGGGGSQAEALKYVNYIRERAYGDQSHNWTSLSMQDLRDERCRELYQENTRRTDLIRWNQWCTGYTWEWKGGDKNGTNLPEYTKLYPIPQTVITASNFEQTTGY